MIFVILFFRESCITLDYDIQNVLDLIEKAFDPFLGYSYLTLDVKVAHESRSVSETDK